MTESDWNSCADPQAMLDFLQGTASDRKLRLFTCAYCRYILQENPVVLVAERFADGLATNAERKHAQKEAVKAATFRNLGGRGGHYTLMTAAASAAARILCPPGRIYRECGTLARTVVTAVRVVNPQAADELQQAQVMVLRDIFGNPFRPTPAIDSAWLSWNDGIVGKLAQTIYDERILPEGLLHQSRLAILADALEESGCNNQEILVHCRSRTDHVRGCWLIDLILGKS